MKLLNVFTAYPVFAKISNFKMNPKTAYAVLKYARTIGQEYELIEKQRVALIHELTGTKDGENASIEPNTKMHMDYVVAFGAILDVESEVPMFGCSMDCFLDKISDDRANDLTVQEIGSLEPCFTV
jgi:hypothetical protein